MIYGQVATLHVGLLLQALTAATMWWQLQQRASLGGRRSQAPHRSPSFFTARTSASSAAMSAWHGLPLSAKHDVAQVRTVERVGQHHGTVTGVA